MHGSKKVASFLLLSCYSVTLYKRHVMYFVCLAECTFLKYSHNGKLFLTLDLNVCCLQFQMFCSSDSQKWGHMKMKKGIVTLETRCDSNSLGSSQGGYCRLWQAQKAKPPDYLHERESRARASTKQGSEPEKLSHKARVSCTRSCSWCYVKNSDTVKSRKYTCWISNVQ